MLPERIGVFWPWRRRSACRWPAPRRPRRPSPAAARARGELVIGLPYVAPPPVAGAKIRTPDGLDVAAAEKLAQSLGLQFSLRQLTAEEAGPALASGQVDLVLGERAGVEAAAAVPGAQLAWQGTGCRPSQGRHSQRYAHAQRRRRAAAACAWRRPRPRQRSARLGAEVRTYRVPSDALVAVREGDCDVGLIDDALWEPLMRFPEWKKFSSTLAAEGMRAERAWLVSAAAPADRAWLAAEMRAWDRAGAWKALAASGRATWPSTYLDQEVPDCHGWGARRCCHLQCAAMSHTLTAPCAHQEDIKKSRFAAFCRARVHGG